MARQTGWSHKLANAALPLPFILGLLAGLFPGSVARAATEDWTQFRGPNGNGVVEKLEYPESWDAETHVAWSREIAGGGLSSPVIVGDKVFLTTAIGAGKPIDFAGGVANMGPKRAEKPLQFKLMCLSLKDGSPIWDQTVATAQPEHPIHSSNSFATESPASDGEHLFVYFAAIGRVAAFDFDGNQVWQQDIGSFPTGNGFGSGSSVAIGDGKVFIQCDNDQKSFVVAFDAKSGEPVWRKERSGRTSWATPIYWKNAERSELILCGSGFVTSYRPADGEILWQLNGIGMSFSASPAADDQRIYFGNSGPRSSGPLISVAAGMQGEQTFADSAKIDNMAWSRMQAGPGMSSPIVVGDYLYVPSRGILTCYNANDGSVVYKQRVRLGSAAASMWAAGDRVFLMDEKGQTLVLKNGPEFEPISTNSLGEDTFWSTPAISGSSLLIRGADRLYCIRN